MDDHIQIYWAEVFLMHISARLLIACLENNCTVLRKSQTLYVYWWIDLCIICVGSMTKLLISSRALGALQS